MPGRLMRRLRRLRALSGTEQRLLLEVALALATARLLLAVLPFKAVMRLFGLRAVAAGDAEPGLPEPTPAQVAAAAALGRAIVRFARHMPFRAMCLQQSLAGAVMLRRRRLPVIVRFGVNKDADRLEAHAWTICGGALVTGAGGMERFAPIATFSP